MIDFAKPIEAKIGIPDADVWFLCKILAEYMGHYFVLAIGYDVFIIYEKENYGRNVYGNKIKVRNAEAKE